MILNKALLRARWEMLWLGTAGKIGIGLFVFSAVFFLAAVSPRYEESNELMDKAKAMQVRLRSAPVLASRGKMEGDQALQIFYAFFPRIDSSPFWINELVKVAEQSEVQISGSEYRMVREKEWKLARYEIVLPVRGRYPQLRAFIADALRAVPAMALVDVAIKRENVESELLEARLRFNLYLSEGRK